MNLPLLHVLSENSVPECGVKTEEIVNAACRMKSDTVAVADYACLDAVFESYASASSRGVRMLCAVSVDYVAGDGSVPGSSAPERTFRIVLIAKDDAGYDLMCGVLSSCVSFDGNGYRSCRTGMDVLGNVAANPGHLLCLTGGIDGISRLLRGKKKDGPGKNGSVRSRKEIVSDISKEKARVKALEKETAELRMSAGFAGENGTGAADAEKRLKEKTKELSAARKTLRVLEEEERSLSFPSPEDDGFSDALEAASQLKEIFGDNLLVELSPSVHGFAGELVRLSGELGLDCVFAQDAVTLSATEEETRRLYLIRRLACGKNTPVSGEENRRRLYGEDGIREEFADLDPGFAGRTFARTLRLGAECADLSVFAEKKERKENGNALPHRDEIPEIAGACERKLYGVPMKDLMYDMRRAEKRDTDSTVQTGLPREDGSVPGRVVVATSNDAFEEAADVLGNDPGFEVLRVMEKERIGTREAFRMAGGLLAGTAGRASKEVAALSERINAWFRTSENAGGGNIMNEMRTAFGGSAAYGRIAWAVKALAGLPTGRYLPRGGAVVRGVSAPPLRLPAAGVRGKDGKERRVLFTGTENIPSGGYLEIARVPCPYADVLLACAGNIRGVKDFSDMFLPDVKREVFDGIYSSGKSMHIAGSETENTVRAWRKIGPRTMDDICAGIVLSAAKGNMPLYSYVKRKNENEYINYRFDGLKAVTGPTFGRFLYEEQVADAMRVAAGYGLHRSRLVLSVMKSGVKKFVEKEKEDFVDACIRQAAEDGEGAGLPPDRLRSLREDSRAVFNEMKKASPYLGKREDILFEASLSYACAYMKLKHPREYMTAVLSLASPETFPSAVAECGRMGIRVLLPDINRAGEGAVLTGDGDIYCGLNAVAGLETDTGAIVREREKGIYRGIVDFMKRTGCTSKDAELLIKAGAFDFETGDRRAAIGEAAAVESAVRSRRNTLEKLAELEKKGDPEGTLLDRRSANRKLAELDERLDSVMLPRCGSDPDMNAVMEKEVFGTVIGSHPLDGCLEAVPGAQSAEEVRPGKRIVMAGVVRETETFRTASKDREMAVFTLEDRSGTVRVIVFPECFARCAREVRNGSVVRVSGMCIRDRANPEETVVAAKDVSAVSGLIRPVVVDGNVPGWREVLDRYASAYGHPVILLRDGRLEVLPVLAESGILEEDPDLVRECYCAFPL